MFLANLPVLLIALGMTLVIATGEIDISVGSMFAICGVAAGILAKAGLPVWLACAAGVPAGAALGSINGALVSYVGIPSIVVTLATMVALRDGLRWATDGAWVQDLPRGVSMARAHAVGLPLRRRRGDGRPDAGVRVGAAPPRRRPRDLCDRLEPGRRASRRAQPVGGEVGGVHGPRRARPDSPPCSTRCASTRSRATPASAWR